MKTVAASEKPILLLVEEHEDIAEVICHLIQEDGGFQCVAVHSEVDAYSYLSKNDTPAFIVAEMPTVTVRFIRVIRKQDIPLIITSVGAARTYLRLKKLNIDVTIVEKPFDSYALLNEITNQLKRRKRLTKLSEEN